MDRTIGGLGGGEVGVVETEGARRATGVSTTAGARGEAPGPRPDPEVPAKARRRRYSVAEKRRILEAADRCTKPGELGALLRREGIYSSQLGRWRKQRESGLIAGLSPRKRGRKPQRNPLVPRVAALERENERLRRDLEKAQKIIEVQKKVAALLKAMEDEPDCNAKRG